MALHAMSHLSGLHSFASTINQLSSNVKMFNLYDRQSVPKEMVRDDFESDEELSYTETEIEEFDAL